MAMGRGMQGSAKGTGTEAPATELGMGKDR